MNNCPVAHAKAYPFAVPEGSFVLDCDGWRPVDVPPPLSGRHAVIASGSNASPDRLMAKYADHMYLLEVGLPVMRAQLHDFDAVYSAHFASYGSIPATFAHAPGAISEVFVTWLTDAQLQHMHKTEGVGVNYDFVKLSGIHLLCDSDAGMTSAHTYLSKRGCLNKNGQPVSLAAVKAKGRQWSALTQGEILDYARTLIAPHEDTDSFIRKHIECPETRSLRTQHLSQNALSHGWIGATVVGG